jgi:hypothetical protein
MNDYRLQHTAPTSGTCITDLRPMWGQDIYDHPRRTLTDEEMRKYASAWFQTVDARDNPDRMILVCRAMPPDVEPVINSGDWVTTAPSYAAEHGMHKSDSVLDWPVYVARVPASTLFNDGSSVWEYGYAGPTIAELERIQ